MKTPYQDSGPVTAQPEQRRPRQGQTIVEFALTLPLLLLLLFGIVEFGRIFQAWVTLQNAAREAARYAVTGKYDNTMFPIVTTPGGKAYIDHPWDQAHLYDPAGSSAENAHAGVPCPYVNPNHTGIQPPATPAGYAGGGDYTVWPDPTWFFKEHWGFICNGADEGNQFLRTDMFRLVGITKAAQIGAAGLGMTTDGQGNIPMDIPGTGIGTQVTWSQGDNNLTTKDSLLWKAENQRGWFHVFICSTRASQGDGQGNAENNYDPGDGTPAHPAKYTAIPLARYAKDEDHVYLAGHQTFGECAVQEGGPDSTHSTSSGNGPWVGGLPSPNPFVPDINSSQWNTLCPAGAAAQSPCLAKKSGINQYDAGGPGEFVDIVVYFNHPLITPLGLVRNPSTGQDRGFIQLQARRVAINESFRSAKVINISNQSYGGPTDPPRPSLTPSNTYTATFTDTPTNTPTNTPSNTPSNTASPMPTNTVTPSVTSTTTPTPAVANGQILHEVWEINPNDSYAQFTSNYGVYGHPDQGDGTPSWCEKLTTTDAEWADNPPSDGPIHNDFSQRMSGFIIPQKTDNYTFYIESADRGQFWLSTNATPGAAVNLLSRGATQRVHMNSGNYTSVGPGNSTVPLQAFQKYFFYIINEHDDPTSTGNIYNLSIWWKGGATTNVGTGNGVGNVITAAYLSLPDNQPNCNAATATMTPSTTRTPSRTMTSTVTQTPSVTLTPSRTNTVTPTFTPSNTPTRTWTPTITPTFTPSLTPSLTLTFTPSKTATITLTPSKTDTATASATKTASATATATKTASATSTSTQTPLPSNTPSKTNTATATLPPSKTNTATVTSTPSQTKQASATLTPSKTPTKTKVPPTDIPTTCPIEITCY